MSYRGVLAFAILLVTALLPAPSTAQQISGLAMGFAGHYRVGLWTVARVEVRADEDLDFAGRVAMTLPDGDGVPVLYTSQPCEISAGESRQVELFVRPGRHDTQFTVALLNDQGQPLARRTFAEGEAAWTPLPSSQQLIGMLGSTYGLDSLPGTSHRPIGSYIAPLASVEELPTEWYGYQSLDVLLLSPTAAQLEELLADETRLAALLRWVELGGRLVLPLGGQPSRLLDSLLSEAAPVSYTGEQVPLRLTRAWETFSGVRQPLEQSRPLIVPRLEFQRGVVEAQEGDLPLVVRGGYGFGEVTVIAADLGQPPFADWPGTTATVVRLLNRDQDIPDAETAQRLDRPNAFGVTDVAGQLRSALDRFPGTVSLPFYIVAGLLVGYVLLLWPVEPYVLRRLFHRPVLTWYTFPLLVLVTCAAGYALAAWSKGADVRVHTAEVVDIDLDRNLLRGTAFFHVFSPRSDRYDVTWQPATPSSEQPQDLEQVLGWFGLPGTGLGAMDARLAPVSDLPRYSFSQPPDQAQQVPILQWSSKSFVSRWSATAEATLQWDLTTRDGQFVRGTLTNPLDVKLSDCLLAFGRYAYAVGELEPGATISVGPNLLDTTELETQLTYKQVVRDEEKSVYVEQATPYDQSSLDAGRILRQMLFYDASGGFSYLRLLGRYQGDVDLSDQVELGRAILLARPQTTGSQALVNNQPIPASQTESALLYRFIIPVQTVADE